MYEKIGFKDRIDTKSNLYKINGENATIEKDNSGLKQEGSKLNSENLNHIENGILKNSEDIEQINKNFKKQEDEILTLNTRSEKIPEEYTSKETFLEATKLPVEKCLNDSRNSLVINPFDTYNYVGSTPTTKQELTTIFSGKEVFNPYASIQIKDSIDYNKELKDIVKETTNLIHVNYKELKNLIDNKHLNPGAKYLLIDYATKYQQPTSKTIKTAEIEPLILTASSTNTLEPIAYSPKYPQDIIHYDINNNKCEDDKTPRNGFIIKRIDTINKNEAPGDFRGLLWIRYAPDEKQYYLNDKLVNYEVWSSGSAKEGRLYKSGNAILFAKNNMTPKATTDSEVFEVIFYDITNENDALFINDKTTILKGISIKLGKKFERKTFGTECADNKLGEKVYLYDTVLGKDCVSNVLASGCGNITFGEGCRDNFMQNNCYNNLLAYKVIGNSFENECQHIFLNTGCTCNKFGSSCSNSALGARCHYNSFGLGNDHNYLGVNSDTNSFGNYCQYNSFGNECFANNFGNVCLNNHFDNKCDGNILGNKCRDNTFGFGCSENKLGIGCEKNVVATVCTWNVFGNGCSINTINSMSMRNTFLTGITNNKFPANMKDVFVKILKDKNISHLKNECSLTIQENENGQYVQNYVDRNGNVISRPIA